ncbi:maleylpyruvate isomerase family mycothiol-dependent enzyme [Streptomyces sp. O3]
MTTATATGSRPRDPNLPARLLTTERDALIALLRATPDDRFALRTACPGWTVREVLAHCGAALVRIVEGRLEEGVFSPESNAADVAERADWPLARIVDELEYGLTEAGPVIAGHEDGRLDAVALGEWVHAGDVREAFGAPGAYAGDSTRHALPLLAEASRSRETPRLYAYVPDHPEPLVLGNETPSRAPAAYHGDVPTLIRLYAGRPLVGTRYTLTAATESDLLIYR